MKTVWVYVDTSKNVDDVDHLKVESCYSTEVSLDYTEAASWIDGHRAKAVFVQQAVVFLFSALKTAWAP